MTTHSCIPAWRIAWTKKPGWLQYMRSQRIGRSASLIAQLVKNLPAMLETWVQPLGLKDPLEKGMTTHSSILAWRIAWTEEPGGLQ